MYVVRFAAGASVVDTRRHCRSVPAVCDVARTRMPVAPGDPTRFDRAYYQRFYGRGGVHDAERVAHLAAAVHHMAAWWGAPIRTVLDIGAGVGLWRDWYREHHPVVRVQSIDVSEHACATWGHERRDISEWRPRHPRDLVICHGVLHYLDAARAEQAIANIVTSTGRLLYLEVPTRGDMNDVVDPSRTDMNVHRRSGAWYRRRLEPELRQVGAGLWARRDRIPMFELEAVSR
jgi:SAM-dependent methyltransferase